jgi:hypothetical protein
MKGKSFGILAVFLFTTITGLCVSACNSSPTSATTVSTIAVTGLVPAVGSTAQFTATATFASGSTQDVSSTSTWTSSNTAVATVSSSGLVTAVGAGSATIQASYSGVAGTDNITISQ